MNVFILHEKPTTSVSYLVDDHVAFVTVGRGRPPIRSCKMAIEACQLLSCAHWFGVVDRAEIMRGPKELWPAPYKSSHMNHPWAIAARSSIDAYAFVWQHAKALLEEHEYRTGKRMESVCAALALLETPPQAIMHGAWKIPVCRAGSEPVYTSSMAEAVAMYRHYYGCKIERMPHYTRRDVPEWYTHPNA